MFVGPSGWLLIEKDEPRVPTMHVQQSIASRIVGGLLLQLGRVLKATFDAEAQRTCDEDDRPYLTFGRSQGDKPLDAIRGCIGLTKQPFRENSLACTKNLEHNKNCQAGRLD